MKETPRQTGVKLYGLTEERSHEIVAAVIAHGESHPEPTDFTSICTAIIQATSEYPEEEKAFVNFILGNSYHLF